MLVVKSLSIPLADALDGSLSSIGDFDVPPMEIQHIDIARPKLLQAFLDTKVERFRVVARVIAVHRIWLGGSGITSGELRCHHHLVPHAVLFHPLANIFLALLILVIIAGVDEVAALIVEVVQDLEHGLFRTFTHETLPGLDTL
jgi:hypothetical protein